MDIWNYRRFIIQGCQIWQEIWQERSENYWTHITKNISSEMELCKSQLHEERFINHALVNNGSAFWLNDEEIVLGYKLISNEQIIRPIFSPQYAKMKNKVLTELIPYSNRKIKCIRNTNIMVIFYNIFVPDVITYLLSFVH